MATTRVREISASAALAAILLVGHGALGDPPAASAPPARATEATTAEGLLDELEASDATLRTFQCNVVYDKVFELQDDRHIRMGRLYFSNEPGPDGGRPVRKFAVDFDTLILDSVTRPEQQALIFDGEFLVEKRQAEMQWVRTRIAKPGTKLDPLRLGEGPLPIPFGQSRAAIMARFDAELLPADAEVDWEGRGATKFQEYVRGSTQLKLTPKPGAPDADQFSEIRLWYSRNDAGRLLPRLAFTIDRKGDSSFVQLAGAQVDAPLPEGVIDMTEPSEADGWSVQINPDRFGDEGGDE